METAKQFLETLKKKLLKAVDAGNVDLANEITANLMVGFVMVIMGFLIFVSWILNEFGVFTVDKALMRECAIISIVLSTILSILNRTFHGDNPHLKYIMILGLILQCGALSCMLGHNVTMITALPTILSIRYFNQKFSVRMAIYSTIAFFIAAITCGLFGVVNLNIVKFQSGTTLPILTTLRAALESTAFDRKKYLVDYMIGDFLPRGIAFSVIAIVCCDIAKRGRQLIDFQNQITKKTSRIETELNLATEIQSSMLPCTLPAFPNHKNLELFAKNIPAKEVGGDFYDYFVIDDDHVAVEIADVSGKGVGAALFMMISKTVLKNQLLNGLSPAQAMTNANQQLCENNKAGLFVTVWLAVYEVSTGILRYVNAGHNPPIIKRPGDSCLYLKGKRGFVLAGLETAKYTEQEIQLKAGDELFLYTDGVTEATSKDNQLFGEDRLLERLDEINSESVADQVGDIITQIDQFAEGVEQFDDITMLGMKVH